MMASEAAMFDYHGALVVVEIGNGEIVLIHPPGGSPEGRREPIRCMRFRR
jgi:hypothetical protein